jgi:hypothetical protein
VKRNAPFMEDSLSLGKTCVRVTTESAAKDNSETILLIFQDKALNCLEVAQSGTSHLGTKICSQMTHEMAVQDM